MMVSEIQPQQDFGVFVDASLEADAIFPPPSQWTSQLHKVEPLTFHVHSNPSVLSSSTTSQQDSQAPAILTIPDIGQGENTFCAFFEYCRRSGDCPQIDLSPAHFHACLPGHELNAPNLAASEDVSMDATVKAIGSLLTNWPVQRVVALGIGWGATALLRAAAKMPSKFSGLVLISPVITALSVQDRLYQASDSVVNRQLGLGLSRRIKDRLLSRWLSPGMNEENSGPAVSLEEDLDRRNANNVLRLISEDIWRADATPVLKQIRTRALLLTGRDSALRYHVEDTIHEFDVQSVSRLDIKDIGSLVHDEEPERVARSLSLFLRGIPGFN